MSAAASHTDLDDWGTWPGEEHSVQIFKFAVNSGVDQLCCVLFQPDSAFQQGLREARGLTDFQETGWRCNNSSAPRGAGAAPDGASARATRNDNDVLSWLSAGSIRQVAYTSRVSQSEAGYRHREQHVCLHVTPKQQAAVLLQVRCAAPGLEHARVQLRIMASAQSPTSAWLQMDLALPCVGRYPPTTAEQLVLQSGVRGMVKDHVAAFIRELDLHCPSSAPLDDVLYAALAFPDVTITHLAPPPRADPHQPSSAQAGPRFAARGDPPPRLVTSCAGFGVASAPSTPAALTQALSEGPDGIPWPSGEEGSARRRTLGGRDDGQGAIASRARLAAVLVVEPRVATCLLPAARRLHRAIPDVVTQILGTAPEGGLACLLAYCTLGATTAGVLTIINLLRSPGTLSTSLFVNHILRPTLSYLDMPSSCLGIMSGLLLLVACHALLSRSAGFIGALLDRMDSHFRRISAMYATAPHGSGGATLRAPPALAQTMQAADGAFDDPAGAWLEDAGAESHSQPRRRGDEGGGAAGVDADSLLMESPSGRTSWLLPLASSPHAAPRSHAGADATSAFKQVPVPKEKVTLTMSPIRSRRGSSRSNRPASTSSMAAAQSNAHPEATTARSNASSSHSEAPAPAPAPAARTEEPTASAALSCSTSRADPGVGGQGEAGKGPASPSCSPRMVLEVVYEHQRYQPFRGWGHKWPGHFLPTDRHGRFCNAMGQPAGKADGATFQKAEPQLPGGWVWASPAWQVDLTGRRAGRTDEHGWVYSIDFRNLGRPNPMKGMPVASPSTYVRRRRWVRPRVCLSDTDTTREPSASSGGSVDAHPSAEPAHGEVTAQKSEVEDEDKAPRERSAAAAPAEASCGGKGEKNGDVVRPAEAGTAEVLGATISENGPAIPSKAAPISDAGNRILKGGKEDGVLDDDR